MFNKEENIKDEIILMTLSEIVPKDHFLKKVAEAIDFKFILNCKVKCIKNYKKIHDIYNDKYLYLVKLVLY